MAKKVQLLTTDSKQEVLHPETTSDMVQHGGSTLDVELGKKLGKTEKAADSSLLNGVADNVNLVPNTIVKRNDNANINVGDAIAFNDINGNYLGAIAHRNERFERHVQGLGYHTMWDNSTLPVEEGDFTPKLSGTTVAGSHTYTSQIGRYYRVGRLCHFSVHLRIPAGRGNMQGEIRISGLPFANRGVLAIGSIGYARGFGLGANYQLGAYCEAGENANYIRLMYSDIGTNTSAYGPVTHTNLPTSSEIDIALSFVIRVQ